MNKVKGMKKNRRLASGKQHDQITVMGSTSTLRDAMQTVETEKLKKAITYDANYLLKKISW